MPGRIVVAWGVYVNVVEGQGSEGRIGFWAVEGCHRCCSESPRLLVRDVGSGLGN